MADQLYLEISVDLFGDSISPPRFQVRPFANLEDADRCTCNDIQRRQGRSLKWNEKFTQRIVRWEIDSSQLFAIYDLMQSIYTETVDLDEHRKALFRLKNQCACHTLPERKQSDNIKHAWGLLDLELTPESGNLFQNSDLSSFEMIFDKTLPPTPLVLKIAKSKTQQQVRQRVNQEVSKVLTANLTSKRKDDAHGYLYIMQSTTFSRCVKIGWSAKDPAIRHDELKSCHEDLQLIARTNLVAHASKVERLVHAELTYYRRRHDCDKCGKGHTEWFEVPADIAQRAILRWSRWLASCPYKTSNGELKQTWRDRLVNKKVTSVVAHINDFLKPYLNQRYVSASDYHGAELSDTEKIRKHIHDVNMINVKNESTRWQSPSECE